MFHAKTKWSTEMIYVYDFCRLCAEGETVKLSFFDTDTDDFIANVVLHDAKTSFKTLSAICGYGYVEYFYTKSDVICVNARVHACDL